MRELLRPTFPRRPMRRTVQIHGRRLSHRSVEHASFETLGVTTHPATGDFPTRRRRVQALHRQAVRALLESSLRTVFHRRRPYSWRGLQDLTLVDLTVGVSVAASEIQQNHKRAGLRASSIYTPRAASRELVFQDRARCHRSRRLLLNWRSTQETHAIHPSLQPQRKADSLGLFGPFQAHQGRFAFLAYRPLVACNRGFDTAATVDASRLAASLVGQILPVFSLLVSLPSGRTGGLAGIDLPVTGH